MSQQPEANAHPPGIAITFPEALIERVDDYLRRFLTVQLDTPKGEFSGDDGVVKLTFSWRLSPFSSDTQAMSLRLRLLEIPSAMSLAQVRSALDAECARMERHVVEAFQPDESSLVKVSRSMSCEIGWLMAVPS